MVLNEMKSRHFAQRIKAKNINLKLLSK